MHCLGNYELLMMETLQHWIRYYNLDIIQLLALLFGIGEVLLARANNILLYPFGITSVVFSIISLVHVQLYAESILHLYYLVMSIYGWIYWSSKQEGKSITVATKREWLLTGLIVLITWSLLYLFLIGLTSSDVPMWDAWVSATAWAGTWLLARRKVENWILLNISNAFAIPLLFRKDLTFLAGLTIFLFIVAVKGYFDWLKIARNVSPSTNHQHAR